MHRCSDPCCSKMIKPGEPFVPTTYGDEVFIFCSNTCHHEYLAQAQLFVRTVDPFHEPLKPPKRSEVAAK